MKDLGAQSSIKAANYLLSKINYVSIATSKSLEEITVIVFGTTAYHTKICNTSTFTNSFVTYHLIVLQMKQIVGFHSQSGF